MFNNIKQNNILHILSIFLFFNFLISAAISSETIIYKTVFDTGLLNGIYLVLTWLTYSLIYLIPAILLTALIALFGKFTRKRILITTIAAVFTASLTSLLLYANYKIYSLYGTYINGFIVNLVITPGGIDSLGGSTASTAGFVAIALGFVMVEILLFWLAGYLCGRFYANTTQLGFPLGKALVSFLLIVFGVHFSYAGYEAFNNDPVVASTNSVPFFQPVSARHFFKNLGFDIKHDRQPMLKGKLNYPLNPLNIKAPAKPYNIIWLTAESWRADTLNDHIMPATWKFAEGANRFTQNYSGGNGTRMGVFSMFTGLPGNYWFPFLDEDRGAALIDVLQQQQYQIHIYTSALFSYPEFSKTLFSKLQKDQMQELQNTGKLGWERDRKNVTDLLNFIDTRDKSKPFFTFMFFESPHARYYFPPESVIAKPYNDDINYASLDKKTLRNNITPIKNRYINAVHHLDSQFDRVFKYLDDNHLRDNTIVILVGDHGEEFMEHGFWGHNSTFVDEQVRTPLVIWQPGQAPKVHDKLTSHMDIIPTVMPLLGVQNPVSDYALGYNLMGNETRPYTYISDWSRITYRDSDKKITIPIRIQGFTGSNITGGHDEVLSNEAVDKIKQQKAAITVKVFEDLSAFTLGKIRPGKKVAQTPDKVSLNK